MYTYYFGQDVELHQDLDGSLTFVMDSATLNCLQIKRKISAENLTFSTLRHRELQCITRKVELNQSVFNGWAVFKLYQLIISWVFRLALLMQSSTPGPGNVLWSTAMAVFHTK
jgi:hypothetical protein